MCLVDLIFVDTASGSPQTIVFVCIFFGRLWSYTTSVTLHVIQPHHNLKAYTVTELNTLLGCTILLPWSLFRSFGPFACLCFGAKS